jgi:hypothetical protein
LEVPTGKRDKVPKFDVTVQVNFTGEIEADTEEQAEQMAHTAWGENFDAVLRYESVESVELEEIEEEEEEEEED